MKSFLMSFLEGYGSVLIWFPQSNQDDAENIRRDWIQVGNYLKHAIEELEEEVQLNSGKPSGKAERTAESK